MVPSRAFNHAVPLFPSCCNFVLLPKRPLISYNLGLIDRRAQWKWPIMICPHCRATHENVRGKCPHCGSDFHGHVREKRVVQPRDLPDKFRCAHGNLRARPCPKCERSPEDCLFYQRDLLSYLKTLFSESEAEKRSKEWLSALDLIEAQNNR